MKSLYEVISYDLKSLSYFKITAFNINLNILLALLTLSLSVILYKYNLVQDVINFSNVSTFNPIILPTSLILLIPCNNLISSLLS